MAGKLIEPKVITDFNNKPVAMLPVGFYFDDARWDAIWAEFDLKGSSLILEDLQRMFPDDESLFATTVKRTGSQLGEDFNTLKDSE